jgi:sigma-B regulation protein RsbU (phosphoserine phosphatase)
MKAIIASDHLDARHSIENCLDNWGYRYMSVANGADALKVLRDDPEVSVVIADWVMPMVDGLEFCRRARRLQRPRNLFIVLLAAREQPDLIEGIKAGADVFLRRPFDPMELQALILVADRVSHLERRLEIAKKEYADQLTELNEAYRRLREDSRAAGHIQSALFPTEPPIVPGLNIRWVFEPRGEVASDMFNVFRLDENNLGFWVLDAPGQGVPVALLSVTLSRALTPHIQADGLLKIKQTDAPFYSIASPGSVASELNRRSPDLEPMGQFFSFFYGVLNVKERVLTFVRAGQPGVVRVSRGISHAVDNGSGPPIGVSNVSTFEEGVLRLDKGDLLIVHTDGVGDAQDDDGQSFGAERILETLGTYADRGVEAAIHALRERVLRFCGGDESQRQDIAILGVEIM